MYLSSLDSLSPSLKSNQGHSPLNRINLDMDMENLFDTQDYYAGQGLDGNQDYYTGQDYSMGHSSGQGSAPVEDDSPVEEVVHVKANKQMQIPPRIGAFCAVNDNAERRNESASCDPTVLQKTLADYEVQYHHDFISGLPLILNLHLLQEEVLLTWKPSKSLDLVQDPTHLQLADPAQQVIQTQFKPVIQIVLTSLRHPWDPNATTFPKILTMSTRSGSSPTTITSVVRNTVGRGKEKSQENPNEPASDAALREFCDKNYNQLLPILAEKMHQEKVQQEKLKAVKARLNFEETSQYSESGAPSRRRDIGKRLGPKDARSMSRALNQDATNPDHLKEKIRKERRCSEGWKRVHSTGWVIKKRACPHTPVFQGVSYITAAAKTPKAIIRVPTRKERSPLLRGIMTEKHTHQRSSMEDDDLSQPWVCEETDPFMPRIRYFDLPKRIRMPSHVKTYDGSEDPEDHLNIFQAATKVEWWAMPTWCHMFNLTLTENARVWFDDLLPESIDSYDDLKEAFLANYLQQKKCIKDPIEIHHIKQREGESTEDFVRRFKIESRDVKGAPKVMRISGFMHGITNPELIKRLHDKISKSVDEI
ncbi:reverse transcriptase domain-containing protein [Tanacetum coccineum]